MSALYRTRGTLERLLRVNTGERGDELRAAERDDPARDVRPQRETADQRALTGLTGDNDRRCVRSDGCRGDKRNGQMSVGDGTRGTLERLLRVNTGERGDELRAAERDDRRGNENERGAATDKRAA